VVDFDVVDMSNLQRQIIHTTDRVGMPKTESAQRPSTLNPGVKVIRRRAADVQGDGHRQDYDVV
jgi:adenylyltransferase/sulfurtransferase